ncbi:phosphotriesterase [Neobacillus cucumis]|uniref:phosphotriesterase family protein n=1 Tax=Neobacillus cucumis TaxID=1740721 RepID=UPI00204208B2|nr:phosphotriesterase [Neobacillus cucumis]MCM3726311.1 phosphotriesterase [Neobacillus cucumis]
MKQINSVTGPIEIDRLGKTLVHEHLRTRAESVAVQFPHLYDSDEEYRLAMDQVTAVRDRGIKTIFDPSVMGLDRDVRFMKRVSEDSGVQIIAATGIYTFHYLPSRFMANDIDFMADQFVRDIEVGVQNSEIKAGFLKCATGNQGITPDVEKVIRAVARAHLRTGVPIMTHSVPEKENGLLQIQIFEEEGVDLSKVLIGHCGDTDHLDYLERVLEKGVYIGMDRYGLTSVISTEQRNATLLALIERGYVNRMFLSQDYCCTSDLLKPESYKKSKYPDWSMTFLLDKVIPTLLAQGVTEEDINILMIENVKSWLS